MAAYEVLLLNTAVPQIQAAQAGDTYVVPRDIAVNAQMTVTGNVGIGGTTLINTAHLTISGSGTGSVTGGGILSLFRPSTSAVAGTNFGSIYFTGADTTSNTPTTLAYIRGQASGTHDPGDNPTDLVFAVTADGTEAVYEAMRLNQAGGIVTQPIAGGHTVFNENGVDADFRVESDTNTHALFVQGSDGFVGIGTSSPQTQLELSSNNGAGTALNILRFNDADTTSLPDQPTGKIEFYINDATAGGTGVASYIMGHAVNTAGGGYLTFATSPNGATGAIERLRIEFHGGLITKPAANGHAVFNEDGVDADFRVESDTNTHALFVEGTNSNVKIGGSAERATTVGTKHLDIFDGTAPVGTLANGISIYSSSGEAYVMDAAGNATLFSPHDAETNEWIFKSKHTPTGKVLKIDVERLLKFVNDHFGLDAVHEFIED